MAAMPPWPQIYRGIPQPTPAEFPLVVTTQIIPFLVDAWLTDSRRSRSDDIVETRAAGFSYLFDLAYERLIAAWGISSGRNDELRDKARMQGHPLSNGPLYHRGHAIPHTLGGGTDINLVPQRGRINIGPFRPLEKKAVASPGALYFTYWLHPAAPPGVKWPTQTPTGVDQGLIVPGQSPEIIRHGT
jgi:hypothetical protein